MTVDIKVYLEKQIRLIDDKLDAYLSGSANIPPVLNESMRYSIFAGGKRLRPVLSLAACEAYGGKIEDVLPLACGIEMIHTYSLIHDDLPAMDDDDLRRGMPTNHIKYGEGMAILAGDALLTKAFEIMPDGLAAGIDASLLLNVIREIAQAAGHDGMVGGQVADIVGEGQDLSLEELENIHIHKTGALLKVSIRAGAMIAGLTGDRLEAVSEFAHKLGLAFQIQDDILDMIGDQAKLGKKVGSDEANAKVTYPAHLGIEGSQALVKRLTEEALAALDRSGCQDASKLEAIANYLIQRDS